MHHQSSDGLGRYVVQGLLTATLPTKIGGDHDVLARSMTFEFFRPVYTGDTICCEVVIDRYTRDEKGRMGIGASFTCTDQRAKVVLRGDFAGVIL